LALYFHNVEICGPGPVMRAARRSGAQSTERTLQLLRVISTRGHFGWRLSDLAQHCEIGPSTAHRLLACLVRERLVHQRANDRHYMPGPMLFELSLALPACYEEFLGAAQASLARLARRTHAMSYLMLRSGSDFVVAARAGTPAQKAFSLEIGTRRPLLTGAGGIAMLVALREDDRNEIVARNLKEIRRFDLARVRSLEKVLAESHKQGYGVHHGQIVPGVHALALAVFGPDAKPFASLSVLGPADILPASRTKQVMALLKDEAACVAQEAVRVDLRM
jgi:DNA-binding IclR family transcriptional regulator